MVRLGSHDTSLILLRGNSGAGKTTVAGLVRERVPGLAIVSHDVVRRDILKVRDIDGNPSIELLDAMVRHMLGSGTSVLVEGILHAPRYGPMLARLARDHVGATCAFFMEVAFEETLRRHATKPQCTEFGEREMRDWWYGTQLVERLGEMVLPQAPTASATAERICAEAAHAARGGAREELA